MFSECGGGPRRQREPLTPGARALFDSCIRTLIVSANPLLALQLQPFSSKAIRPYLTDDRQAPPSCPLLLQLYEPPLSTTGPAAHERQGNTPIRFVAADAGFLPLPLLFADMLTENQPTRASTRHKESGREQQQHATRAILCRSYVQRQSRELSVGS
jgi:hypothetical protein